MKAEDFLPQKTNDDQPLINQHMEDALTHMPTENDRQGMIEAWIWLGFEYLARQSGRNHANRYAECMLDFVKTAQPTRPWKP